MASSKRSRHQVGKMWRFKDNKSEQSAPRTILGLFTTTNNGEDKKCQEESKQKT